MHINPRQMPGQWVNMNYFSSSVSDSCPTIGTTRNTPNWKWRKALAHMRATNVVTRGGADPQRPAHARCHRPDLTLSRRSVELDLDFAVDDADGVGFQIFDCRRVEHLSGTDIKACGVEWALDRLAVEPSV